jgi:hypothetical protein
MKDYKVDSNSAVYSDTIKVTETTDTNHASNINEGPKQLLSNTVANRRDITALQNAKAQLAFDSSDGGLNIIIKED